MVSALFKDIRDFGAVCDGVADDTAAVQAAFTALVRGDKLLIPGTMRITDTVTLRANGVVVDFPAGAAAGSVGNLFVDIRDLVGSGLTVGTVVAQVFDTNTGGTAQATQHVVPMTFTSATQLDAAWEGRSIWLYDATNAANEQEYKIARVVSSTGSGTFTTSILAIAWTGAPVGPDTCRFRIERCGISIRGREVQLRNLSAMPAHGRELHHLVEFTEDDTTPGAQPVTANTIEQCSFGTDRQGWSRYGVVVAQEICPKRGSTHDAPVRANTAAVGVNQIRRPVNPTGFYYQCTVPGTTGASEPAAWSDGSVTARGQVVPGDGGVTWVSVFDFAGVWSPFNVDVFTWDRCIVQNNDGAGVLAGNLTNQCITHTFSRCSAAANLNFWRARSGAQANFDHCAIGAKDTAIVFGQGTRQSAITNCLLEGVSRVVHYIGTAGGGGPLVISNCDGNLGDPQFGGMHPSGELASLGGIGPFSIHDCHLGNPSAIKSDACIKLADASAIGATTVELEIGGRCTFSATRPRTGTKASRIAARPGPWDLTANATLDIRVSTDAGVTFQNSSITFAATSFRNGLADARADEIAVALRTRAPARAAGVTYTPGQVVRAASSTPGVYFTCTTGGTTAPGSGDPAAWVTTNTTGVASTDGAVQWVSSIQLPAEIISATGGAGFGDGGTLQLYTLGAGSPQTVIHVTGGSANAKLGFPTTPLAAQADTQLRADSQGLIDCAATGGARKHVVVAPTKLIDFSNLTAGGAPSMASLDNYYINGQPDPAPFTRQSRCATVVSGTGVPQANTIALVKLSGNATAAFGGFLTGELDASYQITAITIVGMSGSPHTSGVVTATPLKNGVGLQTTVPPGVCSSITYQVTCARAPAPLLWTPQSEIDNGVSLKGLWDADTLSKAIGVINDSTNPWVNSATGSDLAPALVQATAATAAQPTVTTCGPGGHQRVTFDGVAQFVQGATGAFGTGGTIATPYTQWTAFVVGKFLSRSAALSTMMASDIIAGAMTLGADLSTQRALVSTTIATPTEAAPRQLTDPFVFIARLGGGASPFQGGFAYDGVEGTAPNTVLPAKSFIQPMIGKQASGSFANLEIYLCGVYQGWLSVAGAARLTDYARGTYALANF